LVGASGAGQPRRHGSVPAACPLTGRWTWFCPDGVQCRSEPVFALDRGRSSSLPDMDDADIARDELDRHFADALATATAALTDARQRLDDWQRNGISTREDAIAAWKLAARQALAAAHDGRNPQQEIDRVQAMRRWAEAQGYWSAEEDLPAEVEVALRKAIRTANA